MEKNILFIVIVTLINGTQSHASYTNLVMLNQTPGLTKQTWGNPATAILYD